MKFCNFDKNFDENFFLTKNFKIIMHRVLLFLAKNFKIFYEKKIINYIFKIFLRNFVLSIRYENDKFECIFR